MKIAFTTSDRVHINAHFGWARKVDVYEVSPEGYQFLETLVFDGDLKEDGNEDKLLPKIEALHDCTIVYVSAIGGSAAARLIKKHITPIKARSEDDEIQDVLSRLVETLKGSPPPWLRKALQQRTPQFDLDEIEEEVPV
ncbi:nitrogen fixation protein NifX [Oscillatoria sp. FACHB-1407]|uniref:nitrogen fixation protein NifX n=1 Tax=Oscillatoria sp. FACHB-1407 TaxID=2692847 RepID=UPI001683FE1E|nr:nitrogen fixation protein NifX [Oscillatoria sp. FACHB-1407]MBD2459888.1 nitrogen fixation protein NifX [Oscillatoria sp. FACHB-1407]